VIAAVFPDWVSPIFLEGSEYVPWIAGGITPWSDPAGYVQLSAIFHLDKVNTPMLLANGDADPSSLLGMIEMYNGLRLLGKDVTLLRYPDQGHGFKGQAMRDFWERENDFFAKNLLGDPPSNKAQH
jgi:dipeptidyl aminopeptidase/acylaminoacyl peptidase